ncbi:hypothetical protein KIN20_017953 [Parelaphostrongylus tenuis]|uniref:Peptidase M12B domain-containing protein n=1 Tax=Parelaphostrongylus tenuis TaxID=148309 RepID=A0AAD5QR58_PARTN|nr:hypothetical protein KIN20_017953 [Parelaphostrongylus tenuis]
MDGEAAKSQFFLAESVEKSVIDDKTDSPRNDVNYRKVEKGIGGGVSNIPQEKQAKHPIFAENFRKLQSISMQNFEVVSSEWMANVSIAKLILIISQSPKYQPSFFEDISTSLLTNRIKRDTTRIKTKQLPSYYSEFNDGKWRYVELALVADYSVYAKYDKDEKRVNERLQTIAHHVNALYYLLNIRITLVWVDIWKDGDKFEVVTSGDHTLDRFLNYRKEIIKAHPNDNAHMITDIHFESNVVGKAFKDTMCSYDYSGGVDVVRFSAFPCSYVCGSRIRLRVIIAARGFHLLHKRRGKKWSRRSLCNIRTRSKMSSIPSGDINIQPITRYLDARTTTTTLRRQSSIRRTTTSTPTTSRSSTPLDDASNGRSRRRT